MGKSKLLPCPFCGASGIDFVCLNRTSDYWYVKCYSCGALSGKSEDEETALNAWNERDAEERFRGVIRILEKDVAEAKAFGISLMANKMRERIRGLRSESDILNKIFEQALEKIDAFEAELGKELKND